MSLVISLALCLLAASASPQLTPDAEILEDIQVFTLTSPSSGELAVSRTVTVNSDDGLDAATLAVYGDSFRSLKSFNGTVSPANAKTIKLKMGDLTKVAYSEGMVDDAVYSFYRPSGHYPLTVHYEYKISFHKGISSFPNFMPLLGEKVAVKKASFTLDVPEGYPIKHAYDRMEYSFVSEDGRNRHRWEVTDFPAYTEEELMPPFLTLVPYLYSSPEVINLGGHEGFQRNWEELSQWIFDLQKDRCSLSPEETDRVRALTQGCATPLEKLVVLYDYLRERTHYVSIQLGIGGLRPISATEVSRMGFGDCKGLSNYLKALLSAVDVPSDYYVISTDNPNLLKDYASTGQMNHAMLAVPLPEQHDTVWVECTNPAMPLGYRHSNAAGHRVLMVKKEGGGLIRIPAYDTLSCRRQEAHVQLRNDGFAEISATLNLSLHYVQPFVKFQDLLPQQQISRLADRLRVHAEDLKIKGLRNNFYDYPTQGRDYIPHVAVDYTFWTGTYASVSGDRLFVPVNPFAHSLPVQKSTRENDICQAVNTCQEDLVYIEIPEGYRLEGIPKGISLDTEWGSLLLEVTLSDDGRLLELHQMLTLKPIQASADRYASYRDFARTVNRSYGATAVFVKD